jgi:2'-5' RNA ligase
MEVVELLCPVWPPRELAQSGDYRMSGKMRASKPQLGTPSQSSLFDSVPPVPTDRLFLGLFPDASAIERIDALSAQVSQRHDLRVPRHKPERLHVTLFHIGDWAGLPQDTVAAASSAAASLKAEPFEICFDEVASFSGRPDKRPLVLRSAQDNQPLHAFRENLGRELTRVGLGRCVSRGFEPHVTLTYAPAQIAAESIEPIRWTARDFVLIHSLLGQTRYIELGRWPLGG